MTISRRTVLKAGAALAVSAALPVRAQAKPTLRFAAVFSDKDIRADMIRMLAKDVSADFNVSHQHTFSAIFQRDMGAKGDAAGRRAVVTDLVLRYLERKS